VFRSVTVQLAALYTVLFALGAALFGGVLLSPVRQAISKEFEARVRAESAFLVEEFHTDGLARVLETVRERDKTPGLLNFGVQGCRGESLAGRLASRRVPDGWSQFSRPSRHGSGVVTVRVYAVSAPGMCRLLVGDDDDNVGALDGALERSFAWAFAGVVGLGTIGGLALSHGIRRRLRAIVSTAEAIIEGDLSRRMNVEGSSDDLDRLAVTLNRMLDRIATLMDSLKQVSSDIAHDLRTPLTRLRHRLEAALIGSLEKDKALEDALTDLDAILDTFTALLRIAQVESGARRAAFRACDLAAVAATIVDAFLPSAEQHQQSLKLTGEGPITVVGDAQLITQMLANLVENALHHAGPGAQIVVAVGRNDSGRLYVTVRDNGAGIPESERQRVFARFYRLERSRTTPGSGLGLAMVAAVAKLHGAEVELLDAAPGLEARVSFPGAGVG
jgi:signal transduction histidine kinase